VPDPRADDEVDADSALIEPAADAAVDPECCGSSTDVDLEEREDGVRDEWDECDGPGVRSVVPAIADFADGRAAGPEFGVPECGDDASEAVDGPLSARAIPGLLAIAAPTPSATANAPTRPTNRP
jgi:hypothetical protein